MNRRTPRPLAQLLCALALLAGLLAMPAARPPSARASHTPEPTRVTLPGSFGAALGCTEGDWQPSCDGPAGSIPATPAPPQANDLLPQGNGVWAELLGPIPAGSYEFKLAINGDWAENYGANFQQDGPNFALVLPAAGEVKFYYDHKTHYAANNVANTIYTLPGSFNDELGCAGEWQPECLQTLMSDVDGDGVFTFSTDQLPAGSYEFKVATNESWTVSYGQGGGPDNIPFNVGAPGISVTFSFDSATNVPSVQVASPPPPEDAALLRAPVSDPANQDEIFYFVLPDRFADGRDDNDTGGLGGDALATGFKPDDKGYYHGGDLAGLQARIPYLKDLGVTAIWMTPMFENRAVQCDPAQPPSVPTCSAGYHGYWITDFTQVDPHFGTNAEMRALIDAAHAQGMRVFFDIITNHTADVIDYEGGNYSYVSRADFPYRDAGGNIFDDRDYIGAPAFPELNRYSFPKRPFFRTPEDASAKSPAWLNDVTMYHNRGDAPFDGGEGDLYGDFVGLDGLFTERPEVVAGMTEIYKYWISEFGIDGFRVDTVKHVNLEFWQQFVPAIRDYAASQGKPDFFIFGEVFDGNPANLSTYTREGEFPAVLDFDFNYSAGDFAVGSAGPARLSGLFSGDDHYTTADDNAYDLPTFLGNHDIGRVGSRMQFVGGDIGSDQERVQRMLLGYGLMFTARGVPIIYYGDEQGFTGDGNDKDARQPMFPSQVASYNDDDLIGTDATTAAENFDQSHPLYTAIAELAALRKANPALQTGAQIERLSEAEGAGVYAFSRIDRDARVEYVVALNNAEEPRSVSVPTFARNSGFDAIYGAAGSLTTDAGGRLNLTVPALGVVVYKQQAANPGSPDGGPIGPSVTISSPADGATIGQGRVEVAASVSGNVFAEVSFAVSVNGGAYAPIGTDTNAPYRVFYDTTGLPGGANLSFKAVVTDRLGAEGNFNSATSAVTVAAPPVCTVSYEYAVIHYYRADGNYENWGLHLWGDAIADGEATDWNAPKPFLGRDEYGAFAWVRLKDATKPVNFIVHQPGGDTVPDTRDPGGDRSFIPKDTPQIFLKGGDATVYASQAAAQGYVTIHYNRPGGDYDGWGAYVWGDGVDPSEITAWPANNPFDQSDAFGRSVRIAITDATKPLGFIVMNNGVKDVEPDRFITPAEQPSIWLRQGEERVYRSLSEAEGVVTLRYHRPAGDYGDYTSSNFNDFWGLHLWAGTATPNPGWEQPFKPNLPQDPFGIGFRVPLAADVATWAYILHRGNTKDKEADQFLNLASAGNEIWVLQEMPGGYPYLLPMQPGCTLGLGDASTEERAHWVRADSIAWPIVASQEVTYTLHYAPSGGLGFVNGEVVGGASLSLTLNPAGLDAATRAAFPHLADLTALTVGADPATVREILKGQVWVSARTAEQGVIEVTGVQIPGVLDDLYAQGAAGATFGPDFSQVNQWGQGTIRLRLWAPTAQTVSLLLYPGEAAPDAQRIAMSRDDASGVWTASVPASAMGSYYLYEVVVYAPSTGQVETNLVTDPYSVSLATNSRRSQIVDLGSRSLKPGGWDNLKKPKLDAFEDVVLYELHVRDFSITDETVPEALRGTFAAFTRSGSAGMRHLRELARDGLTHVHLLPAFDIATIEEQAALRTEILAQFPELAAMPPDGTEQQARANAIRDQDGFNWGYDPFHYSVPEGSYSTDPGGPQRIVEFREMVRALNRADLRVVMDVVYNHTSGSGQGATSVLDKVVPGYYHRLNDKGDVETSTCCANTATEHAMMRKLMVDSLVQWAKEYKVDGFRFDLMGHHMKADMLAVRQALDGLTIAEDGVDGKKIILYGEGWNFGEVANGARGVNATQRNMAGTGIATFSDRLRDAVRGGGPFDTGEQARRQGFINGLFYDPNGLPQGDERAALLHAADLIRVGMAGNLADYELVNGAGRTVRGEDVDYNGSPGGYTQDPQEVITYIEAHDNETLFDAIQLKAPAGATLAERVRMQNLGISIVMLGQGVPFFQAGQEFLRSKSGDRNSYNSGDWFNRLDWELQDHVWGSGLPIEGDNADNWGVLGPVLANPAIKPGNAEMVSAYEHFRELLRIRKSSPLFRLRTEQQVMERLRFLNTGPDQLPGLIVMQVDDKGAADLDRHLELAMVLVNATDEPVSFTAAELAGARLYLHRELARSHDPVVRGAGYDRATGTFTIPARTTAVFTDRR